MNKISKSFVYLLQMKYRISRAMRNDLAGKADPFVEMEKSPNQVNPKVKGSVQVEDIQMISLWMTEALT